MDRQKDWVDLKAHICELSNTYTQLKKYNELTGGSTFFLAKLEGRLEVLRSLESFVQQKERAD